jgi:cytochrome c5
MKKISIVLLLATLTACTATKLLTPAQTDADRGAQKFKGYTLTDLNQGKTLFETKCTVCHSAKNPASRNEDKWREIVPKMAAKSKDRGKGEIDAQSQELIIKYLVTMGSAPKSN